MKVAELKALLGKVPDNYEVWLSVDEHTEEATLAETQPNHEDYGASGEITIYA